MKNMKRIISLFIVILFIFSMSFSQTKKSSVKITAQKISYDYGKKTTRAEGNVLVIYKPGEEDETRITATLVFYNQDTNVVEVPGKVNIVQKDLSITGENLKADLKKEVLDLKKDVNVILQRKTGEKTETTKLSAQSMNYSLKTNSGTLIGGVKIEREDLMVKADTAEFNTNTEIYVFNNNVVMEDSDKNEIKCAKLTVYVKDKKVEAENNISTTFYIAE
ncbi:MAG TPA: LPS export ABC transporter periplasmic protein LptC [Dictyoglomaceae bacterium]|nr:LPS export ABC transporter periplasmic protein LptC [Dictyoglomaceae bacterium]HOL39275.1 LPS export ABC transporter periplasmic protein LptC [Dictyoglomaceae bacterium]HPP15866.1 LPS export ABC transporter periplasmic protein LptC [Dictyoglomaceae bacterium]